jgi:3-keto-5-aminohexanoate cleavage enzyme
MDRTTTESPPDLIINFTPTGLIPTREMTPHVPLAPAEIISDIREACQLGITSVHLHVRDAEGKPSLDPRLYAETIAGIRQFAPDLVIAVSLSGRFIQDPGVRAAPLDLAGDLKPDLGSLTLGSLNFNKMASINEPDTIVFLAKRMLDRGIKPELEAFDTGMLNFAHYLLRKGHLRERQYVNLIVGNIASAQPRLLHLATMLNDLPPNALWSLGGIGDCQASVHAIAVAAGGGVRVGLEDSLWIDAKRTRLARNVDLIRRVHRFAEMCGRPVMTSADFRRQLGLAPGNGRYGAMSADGGAR